MSIEEVARSLSDPGQQQQQPAHGKGALVAADRLGLLLHVFKEEDYIMWINMSASDLEALIVLKQHASPWSQLKAWCHALLAAERMATASQHGSDVSTEEGAMDLITTSLEQTTTLLNRRRQEVLNGGWNLAIASLEVQSGVRLVCMH